MHVKELLERIENVAPLQGQATWDASGVQIAGRKEDVAKLAVTLDPVPEIIAAALDWGADMILTHHPLSMKPQPLDRLDTYHAVVSEVLSRQAWLYAAHTSLDVQPDGPAGWLARELELQNTCLLEVTHAEELQGVRFHAGDDSAGMLQLLENTPGVLHLQEPGDGELFIVCPVSDWPRIKQVVMSKHPSPAFAMMELGLADSQWGFGIAGDLGEALSFKDFCANLASKARRSFYQLAGPRPETVRRVAYCTGSGSSFISGAKKAGADVFITGDMKYHQALETPLSIIDVGHFILEEEMMRRFAVQLAEDPQMGGVDLLFFPGQDPFEVLLLDKDSEESL